MVGGGCDSFVVCMIQSKTTVQLLGLNSHKLHYKSSIYIYMRLIEIISCYIMEIVAFVDFICVVNRVILYTLNLSRHCFQRITCLCFFPVDLVGQIPRQVMGATETTTATAGHN